MLRFRRLRRFLRTSMLALLVLGLLVRPVLVSIDAGNAAESSLLASNDGHLVHDHVDHDDHGKPCRDQAQGGHHLRGLGASPLFVPVALLVVALVQQPRVTLPPMVEAAVIDPVPAAPFRPPIA